MSDTQRIIKYCAIAFAMALIVAIISGIMYVFMSFTTVFDDDKTEQDKMKALDTVSINQNINELDIDVATSNVTIRESNSFKLETDSDDVKYKVDNGTLYISERNHSIFKNKKGGNVIIYLPSDLVFNDVSIESGVGKVKVGTLQANELDLDLGAGKVELDNLNILHEASIDGGAGETIIENSNLNNLDLDMGVGSLSLTARLTGSSVIDAGVGSVDLKLKGTASDYKIKASKGVGKLTVEGEDMKDDSTYSDGANIIDIDGGVGSINIDFIN